MTGGTIRNDQELGFTLEIQKERSDARFPIFFFTCFFSAGICDHGDLRAYCAVQETLIESTIVGLAQQTFGHGCFPTLLPGFSI